MKTMFASAILGMALMWAGCVSASRPLPVPSAQQLEHPDDRVRVEDSAKELLRVLDVHTQTGMDRLLKIQVDVVETGKKAQTFLYQTDWLDAEGKSLGMASDPLPWTLFAKESGTISITAPSPLVKTFLLKFSLRPRM